MAPSVKDLARLIAIDGSRGADVEKSARRLAKALTRRGVECVISRWDASGLFGEVAQAEERATASARTLSLIYAADLAFRLRWEILPALDTGAVVIAASYVDTAVAFGAGCGLPEPWLRELLRFAPAPAVQALARERKLERSWKPRLDRGYGEYCATLFAASAGKRLAKGTRQAVIARLKAGHGGRYRLEGGGIARAAKAITARLAIAGETTGQRRRHSRRAAASQESSRPRTGRKPPAPG
jgi:hypothetical protein